MKAWTILLHSIRQVFGNLTEALQVSGLLFLLQMALSVALGVSLNEDPSDMQDPARAIPLLAFIVVTVVTMLWMAVAWHRFVLLGERPRGYLPAFHGDRLLGYLGRSILIGLITAAAAVGTSIVIGMLTVALGATAGLTIVSAMVVMIVMLTVAYRLSAALPGVAIGRRTGFTDGWVATVGETPTILALALFSGLAGSALSLPLELLPPGSIPALIWQVLTGWVQLMVSVSILTTLYGHYIEKRPLV